MLLVKKLKYDQAITICSQITQFATMNSNIYHRLINETTIEPDVIYYLINNTGNIVQLNTRTAQRLSDLNIPRDSQVIGVASPGISIFSHTVPYPVYNTTGTYKSRSGDIVTIDSIRPTITYSMSGYLPPKAGKKQPIWTIWTKYGEVEAGFTHPADLVEKL